MSWCQLSQSELVIYQTKFYKKNNHPFSFFSCLDILCFQNITMHSKDTGTCLCKVQKPSQNVHCVKLNSKLFALWVDKSQVMWGLCEQGAPTITSNVHTHYNYIYGTWLLCCYLNFMAWRERGWRYTLIKRLEW